MASFRYVKKLKAVCCFWKIELFVSKIDYIFIILNVYFMFFLLLESLYAIYAIDGKQSLYMIPIEHNQTNVRICRWLYGGIAITGSTL